MARVTIASETSGRSSSSVDRRRQRPSQPSVLSTTHLAREDNEAGPGDAAHDDQRRAEQEAGEQDRQAVVDAVGEHRPEPAVQRLDPAQHRSGAVGVLDVGGVDQDAQ
jgi:hypothetical protein